MQREKTLCNRESLSLLLPSSLRVEQNNPLFSDMKRLIRNLGKSKRPPPTTDSLDSIPEPATSTSTIITITANTVSSAAAMTANVQVFQEVMKTAGVTAEPELESSSAPSVGLLATSAMPIALSTSTAVSRSLVSSTAVIGREGLTRTTDSVSIQLSPSPR